MKKRLEQEEEIDITELAKVLSLDDELELDNDIREWLQKSPVQIREYGLGEADGEEEYYTLLNELSDYYLMER